MIYGSTAIKFWFPDYPHNPNDVDVLSENSTPDTDVHWHPLLRQVLALNTHNEYLDPNLLYTFKLSHLSYPIKWDKHMKDVIFLRDKGCVINHEAYKILMEVWEDVHAKKYGSKSRISLNKPSQQLFEDNVVRVCDHDWLHEQFAFNDKPMYHRIQKDEHSALPLQWKWDQLSPDDKMLCALEECFVVSAERFSLPGKVRSPKLALVAGTKQLITTMTKGWFNLYLKEHFVDIINTPHINHYIECILKVRRLVDGYQG